MTVKLHFTHWYKGGAFHWNDVRFNGGDIYRSFRFGPILLQVRK